MIEATYPSLWHLLLAAIILGLMLGIAEVFMRPITQRRRKPPPMPPGYIRVAIYGPDDAVQSVLRLWAEAAPRSDDPVFIRGATVEINCEEEDKQ